MTTDEAKLHSGNLTGVGAIVQAGSEGMEIYTGYTDAREPGYRVRRDRFRAAQIDGYLVFLTPQGSTTGLYVTRKSAAGFRVREIGNARDSLAFDYRIVAHPYAEHGQRLAAMSAALLPTNHKKPFYRHLKPLRFNNGQSEKSSLPVVSM